MDTQAVYMHSWAYSSPPGADSAHYYLRFLSDGRVALFSGSSNLNNADEASVGYYYLKGDRLRIEYFTVTYGNHGGLSHFLAYRRGEGFVTYGQFLGENVHGSFLLTGLMYRHQMGQWKKIIPDTLRHLRPDW